MSRGRNSMSQHIANLIPSIIGGISKQCRDCLLSRRPRKVGSISIPGEFGIDGLKMTWQRHWEVPRLQHRSHCIERIGEALDCREACDKEDKQRLLLCLPLIQRRSGTV